MAKQIPSKETRKPGEKLNYTYLRDQAREIVKGIFKYYEVPGGRMAFSFREWPGDEIENYDFIDGQMYAIPLGVAKHLNRNGWYPEYGYIPSEKGSGSMAQGYDPSGHGMKITKKCHRFGFQSLEFQDIDDLSTNPQAIISVETV